MSVSRWREDVQDRHREIERLRRKPLFTLNAIALEVGLKDHSSVLHHLNGRCRCESEPDDGCDHDWRCHKCGERG